MLNTVYPYLLPLTINSSGCNLHKEGHDTLLLQSSEMQYPSFLTIQSPAQQAHFRGKPNVEILGGFKPDRAILVLTPYSKVVEYPAMKFIKVNAVEKINKPTIKLQSPTEYTAKIG